MLSDPLIGANIGGFRVEQFLGRGGMCRVYRAEQLTLGRNVALKLLPTAEADDEYRVRFVRESRLAASIDHPNILPIYESGEAGGYLFIAMRLVEGTDLDSILQRDGPLTLVRASSFISQAASALDAAHARGLIHRDVKPGNLLLAGEHLYLTDFGIAKTSGAVARLTRVGLFVGTVDYASPEQLLQQPVDARSDVYSLGCVLYSCLAGQAPFDRPTEHAVIEGHLHEPPPSLRLTRPDLPAALDSVVATALAKDPELRYRGAGYLAAALRAATGQAVAASPRGSATVIGELTRSVPPRPTPSVAASSPGRNSRRAVVLGAALAITATIVLAVAISFQTLMGGLSAAVATASPTASPTPTATPTPTSPPIPTIRPIALKPEQAVMPAGEFPFAGYSITKDAADGATGWRREFSSTTLDYYVLQVYVYIYPPGTSAAGRLPGWTCDFTFEKPPVPVASEVTAEVIGDGARACQYHWEGNIADWQEYITATRNAIVVVAGEPRRTNITNTAAMNQMISLARQQLAILERLAPR